MMYQLKRSGVSQEDLLKVYLTVVRPVLEYACQVWHSNLPQYLSHEIEAVQKRALKAIYPESNYVTALQVAGLTTLEDRRYELCKSYFNKMLNPGP